jgi:Firmicute plasmid replication protein (RepL).
MRNKIIQNRSLFVNKDTGEEIEVIGIIPEYRDANFVKIFQVFTKKVVEDLKIGLNGALYTLMWFIDQIQGMKVNQEPIIVAHPDKIAFDLNISKRTAERHLRRLEKHGYIEQVENVCHVYRINPRWVFKGVLRKRTKMKSMKLERAYNGEIERKVMEEVSENDSVH